MERLTYDCYFGDIHWWHVKGAGNLGCRQVCEEQEENGCKGCPIELAFDRLAAYEDTGLTPEEVQIQKEAMESMGWFGKMFQRYKGDPRGPIGTLGTALGKSLALLIVESAKNRQPVKDVDGNTWLPMLLDEFESMADVIEHGQEWIPVKVRLPVAQGEYIVTACDEGCPYGEGIWYSTVVVVADYYKGCWTWDDYRCEYDISDIVTHWMPLPPGPSAKGEE